jgi:phosphatidylserine/phosphatidylglycerophosphate/cardiolipin synthase-like enzyme
LFFLLVGFGKLPRRRRDKQREVCEAILARTDGLDLVSHRDEWPAWLASMMTMNRTAGSLPMVGGNSAELIKSYSGSIQAMADAIDTAEHFVHLEFFILVADNATEPLFAALERACARGVEVRALSDYVAQFMYPDRKKTIKPMLPLLHRIEVRTVGSDHDRKSALDGCRFTATHRRVHDAHSCGPASVIEPGRDIRSDGGHIDVDRALRRVRLDAVLAERHVLHIC